MARADDTELIDLFEKFYREYYREDIGELAQKYPSEQKSLYIDWQDLYRFDAALADNFRNKPQQLQRYAEEALRLYDLPVDVTLGQAHVRVNGLPERTTVRELSADNRGTLVAIECFVRSTTETKPKVTTAAFECQRCGTLTRIPQETGNFQEPHKCQGCERKGPFRINYDQSEFIDAQVLQIIDDPSNLSEGIVPKELEVNLEDDITDTVSVGERVIVTGIIQLEPESDSKDGSTFDMYLDGMSVQSVSGEDIESKQPHSHAIPDLETFATLASKALSTMPKSIREEETKAKLVTPFVEALGWDIFDGTEVRLEYTDSKTSERPDYALFGPSSQTPDIVIEAKQLGTNLDAKEQQLYDYVRNFRQIGVS